MSQDTRAVIFIGGVPGSGKSYLCGQLARLDPQLRVEGAGQLIRRALSGSKDVYERPAIANTAAADRMQDLLVEAFARVAAEHHGPIVLDGHFVVPTEAGPRSVAPEVFRRLGVSQLVLVEATAGIVADRLRERRTSGWWDGSRDSIARLAEQEAANAAETAIELGLQLELVSSCDAARALSLLSGASRRR